jgi:hypothetical protein
VELIDFGFRRSQRCVLSNFDTMFRLRLSVATARHNLRAAALMKACRNCLRQIIDLHHYEFYIFGGVDGTTAEIDSTGPAFEFNWGAIPRVQLHAILPWGAVAPSNNPVYLPGGTGPTEFGLTDTELGVKIAFIKETKHFPQIGSFPMFEMSELNSDSHSLAGEVRYRVSRQPCFGRL